ncbi:MAG: DUF2130 domain-containing protein [Bacteroides sp.]|nr:DUF2130 domain-containing protein [Bacteroides sp.]MBD5342664.1 DUF2130 domain-containing protein [Bacteroides sp.]
MMNLTCPHCQTVFEVDQNHYADLLQQVKTAEFEREIERRLKEIESRHKAQEEVMKLKLEAESKRLIEAQERRNSDLAAEVSRLKNQIAGFDAAKKAELSQLELQQQLKIQKAQADAKDKMAELELKVSQLNSQLANEKTIAKNAELELKKNHEILLKAKDEEIDRLKDMKSRLSTKMLGESLEQHCFNSFNEARSNGLFLSATFDKDNDASDGSKGDFIFRDFIGEEECISIMFEMKTEMDTTATKHKNEHFFAKLDKDRTAKKCEYAVLVSTLDADNEFYNRGIVDVSFHYDKMFVIRPQFFIPLISLLTRATKRSAGEIISLRQEVAKAQETSIDITNFEAKIDKFKSSFIGHVEAHLKKHNDAIDAIDTAISNAEKQIKQLQKVKGLFEDSLKKLEAANSDIQDKLTIKKLTHGNPTMRAKFNNNAK